MAVNTFLDERQSNTSSPSSSSPETPPNFKSPVGLGDAPEYATSLSDDDLMPSESEHTKQAISESPSTSSKQPADARWAAIRSLRSEMDYHHRLFQTMDAFNDDPIITQLRQYFRTSNELRSIGIGVFKDVLHGYQPDKLEEIFAFASLSYSISQLLYRQKKIEEIDILRGVRLWRDTIRKPEEREAFNKIAQHLWWKEARHHLHFIPVHPLASDGRAKEPPEARDGVVSPTMASLSAYIKPGTASMTQMPTEFTQGIEPGGTNVLKNPYTADLFDDAIGTGTQSHDTLGFSDFSDIDLDDDAWIPQLDFMSTHQLMSDIENSRLQQPCPKKPSNMLEIPQQGQSNGADSPSQTCGSESEKPSLKDTCIFLLVLVFLKEAHDLLYKFSWCGQLSKLPLDLYTQRDAHARFLKLAEEQFFEPRSRDKSLNKDYRAMLSLAKAFAEEPFFKTVDEIKHYLVGIAGVSSSSIYVFGRSMSNRLIGYIPSGRAV